MNSTYSYIEVLLAVGFKNSCGLQKLHPGPHNSFLEQKERSPSAQKHAGDRRETAT